MEETEFTVKFGIHDDDVKFSKEISMFTNKKKNKKVSLHKLSHDAMQRCELTSLVVCISEKNCAIRERNVTIRNEI